MSLTAADSVLAYARWFDQDILSPAARDQLCAAIVELNSAAARSARRARERENPSPPQSFA